MKRIAVLPIAGATLFALSWASSGRVAAADSTLTPDQTAAIDRIGDLSVAGSAAPGVTIAVARDGTIVYAKGFGKANVENGVPATADTRYPIGSNTKQFTATAILMLQDDGKLNIDDPLSKYLPEIPHANQVKIRNLLNHSGGYAEFTEIQTFDEIGNRPATLAQVVGSVDQKPLAFVPGTNRQYSNTGYMLLSMVIERVSGMRYGEFLQKRIFTPVGMTSTYVRDSDDTDPGVATEYESFALGPWEHALHIDYSWFVGAGAIISDAADLSKWNAALDGGKLLSKHSLTEMMTPHKIGSAFPDYGFAIMNSKLPNGHHEIYHGGNTTGAATQDARFPDDDLDIIVLSNSGSFSYDEAVKAIYAQLVPAAAPSPSPSASASAKPVPGANPAMEAAARKWLDDAVAGNIDLSKLRPDMRARMTRAHREALASLAALGPRTYSLLMVDRRPPSTGYEFLVKTPKKTLVYVYSRDDDGSVGAAGAFEVVDYSPAPSASPAPAEAGSARP
jgi:CubicO group peptidase (beta-lactamase class C family)